MRKMLFPGAKAPCAAFFFKPTPPNSPDSSILTYAPILVEQAINRNDKQSSGAWNIIVNSSEIRYVAISDAQTGDPLVWKTVMWGSHRDLKFLHRIAKKFPNFKTFASQRDIKVHTGPELRKNNGRESVEAVPDVKGKDRLVMDRLRNCGRIFIFPQGALEKIPEELCFVREGRREIPLSVCKAVFNLIAVGRTKQEKGGLL